ncbi:MAG: hypothetical protein MJY84_08815 [Bacteroidales bacterium]|nr:hypothetical protein [Bacteroidales bacterium]
MVETPLVDEEKPVAAERQIEVSRKDLDSFGEIGRWSTVLGIFSAIYLGFIVLMGAAYVIIGFTDPLEGVGTAFVIIMGFFFVLMAALFYFPTKYLINAGKTLKKACRKSNQENFSEGVENTRLFFKFSAIYCLAIIPLTFLVAIVAIIVNLVSL